MLIRYWRLADPHVVGNAILKLQEKLITVFLHTRKG